MVVFCLLTMVIQKQQGKDTLQSLKSHKKNIYYENIGKADITYLVNFPSFKKIFI